MTTGDVDDVPESVVSLDLRTLRAHVTNDDGDLVIVASDGDITVTFEPGVGGDWASAARNAEHAAEAFLAYAELLRVRRGDPQPLTPEPVADLPAVAGPAINALGW